MDDLATGFQKLCECAVCLETLNNPRTLKCEHSFCKECIDGIAVFKDDNISITCPTCQNEHIIEGEITDLKAGLLIKQMLDLVNRNSERNEGNCSSVACGRQAIWYYDGEYRCKTCNDSLPCKLYRHKYNVKFSVAQTNLLPNCVEHDSFQTIVCIYCKRLCCKYCKHYHHDNHITMSLEQYNKAKYEENLLKQLQQINKTTSSYRNLMDHFKMQEESTQQKDLNFAKQIKLRKKLIVAKVLHMLEDIEENLLKKFESHKSFALRSIEVEKKKCNDELEELSNVEKRIQDYNKKTQLEKYCDFNSILKDLEYLDSFPNGPNEEELTVTFDENNDQDDMLYNNLSEIFGVEVKARGFPDEETEALSNPTKSFKNVKQNEQSLQNFVQEYSEMLIPKGNKVADESSVDIKYRRSVSMKIQNAIRLKPGAEILQSNLKTCGIVKHQKDDPARRRDMVRSNKLYKNAGNEDVDERYVPLQNRNGWFS